jgi:2-C-methyl-D-erythritol 4-phosphate cytidylyltransferase
VAIALILAAGRGERLGAERPKALVPLAGRPLLAWSVEVLLAVPEIERIVVALPAGVHAPAGMLHAPEGGMQGTSRHGKLGSGGDAVPVIAVAGGAVRSESVRQALAATGGGQGSGLVLIHDAARPLLTVELAQDVLAAAQREGVDCAIAAAPVTDTVKRADREHVVSATLDRSQLWAVQTPQVFRRAALQGALDVPAEVLAQATDDAWLVERAGGTVVVVPAPRENLKVTTPLDIEVAELLLARRRSSVPRPA